MALLDNLLKVQCFGQLSGAERWANVWHVTHATSTPGVPMAQADLDAVNDEFVGFYEGLDSIMSASWTHDQTIISQVDTPGATPSYYSVETVGTAGTDLLPTSDAVVISLLTAALGQSGRGRIYLGGFAEVAKEATSARLTTTARDLIGAAVVALTVALEAALTPSSGLAVYSRLLDEANLCSSFRVGTVFDTQRRRRNKLAELYTTYS